MLLFMLKYSLKNGLRFFLIILLLIFELFCMDVALLFSNQLSL